MLKLCKKDRDTVSRTKKMKPSETALPREVRSDRSILSIHCAPCSDATGNTNLPYSPINLRRCSLSHDTACLSLPLSIRHRVEPANPGPRLGTGDHCTAVYIRMYLSCARVYVRTLWRRTVYNNALCALSISRTAGKTDMSYTGHDISLSSIGECDATRSPPRVTLRRHCVVRTCDHLPNCPAMFTSHEEEGGERKREKRDARRSECARHEAYLSPRRTANECETDGRARTLSPPRRHEVSR